MIIDKLLLLKNDKHYINNNLYLIEKINDECGFFFLDNQVLFGIKSKSISNTELTTTYLDFFPRLEISSVENDPSFEKGIYDFLILKEKEDRNIIETFLNFCELYAKNPSMLFDDFIKGIIDMFQLPKEQSKLDVYGLFGELYFMKAMHEKGFDLDKYWHNNGVFSKYDFVMPNLNIEIKTSASGNNSFRIKHKQVFNNENNLIVLVGLNSSGSKGLSLNQLTNYVKTEEPFCNDVKFLMNLNKELKKEIDKQLADCCFDIYGIFGYESNNVDTIKNIPLCISNVTYDYEFDLTEGMNLDQLLKIVRNAYESK